MLMGRAGGHGIPAGLKERLIRENAETSISMGMPSSEAWELAESMFAEAVKRAQAQGDIDAHPGMGDRLLRQEANSAEARSVLSKLRAEGVADEEIRWWWNMHEIEKQMLILQDEGALTGVYLYWRDQGKPEAEAQAIARNTLVTYGDPEDRSFGTGDDRPLPYELKDRVNRYFTQAFSRSDEFKRRIRGYSSPNVFIRAQMRDNGLDPGVVVKQSGCLFSLPALLAGLCTGGRWAP